MNAPERTEKTEPGRGDAVLESTRTNGSARSEEPEWMPAVVRALDALSQGMAAAVRAIGQCSQQQRMDGHWLATRMLDRLADYLSAWPIGGLEKVCELSLWLPLLPEFEGLSHSESKIQLLDFLLEHCRQQNFSPQERKTFLDEFSSALSRPGRHADVRPKAVYALELLEQGQGWAEIERHLLPHRSRCATGEAMRRAVQRLRTVLARHGIPATIS